MVSQPQCLHMAARITVQGPRSLPVCAPCCPPCLMQVPGCSQHGGSHPHRHLLWHPYFWRPHCHRAVLSQPLGWALDMPQVSSQRWAAADCCNAGCAVALLRAAGHNLLLNALRCARALPYAAAMMTHLCVPPPALPSPTMSRWWRGPGTLWLLCPTAPPITPRCASACSCQDRPVPQVWHNLWEQLSNGNM